MTRLTFAPVSRAEYVVEQDDEMNATLWRYPLDGSNLAELVKPLGKLSDIRRQDVQEQLVAGLYGDSDCGSWGFKLTSEFPNVGG